MKRSLTLLALALLTTGVQAQPSKPIAAKTVRRNSKVFVHPKRAGDMAPLRAEVVDRDDTRQRSAEPDEFQRRKKKKRGAAYFQAPTAASSRDR